MGADCYGVSRADLLPALAGALDEGTIRTGCRVAAVEQVGDGVRAVLEDGSEERGDVLIGADGADSTIRGTLGSSPPPRYPGYTVFLGTAEDPDGSAAPMNKFPMRFGPGRRFATYRIGGDRFCWLAVVNAEEGGQETPERQKAVLLDRFRGWAGPVERIIEMTDEKRVYRRDPHYLEPGAPWGLGRVTLLGDAAHAMTFDMGQGAAQSIEDAYVIGDCLGGSDPVAGLRRYEERRARRAGQMVTLSRRFGRVAAWQSPQLTALRAMLFTLALRTKLIFTVQARDLAYQFERSAG
jgi:2-polyprenyl-6-methoxyphenol hydroxylase-like FAD-dependent oxidoreductase